MRIGVAFGVLCLLVAHADPVSARTRTFALAHDDLRGQSVNGVRGRVTVPKHEDVRLRIGLRLEIGDAEPAGCAAPTKRWIELGYMRVKGARCGSKNGYEGLYFSTDRRACKPLFVRGIAPGARHDLEIRWEPEVGIYRLFVGSAEGGRGEAFEAPIAAAAAGAVTESLPGDAVGPFEVERLGIMIKKRWKKWAPKSACGVPRACSAEVSRRKGAVQATCDSVFGRRLDTHGEEACIVKKSGSVVCWYADLLVGALLGVSDAVEVGTGGSHSCARTSTAKIQCWGSNTLGQLGDGTTEKRTVPVFAKGLGSAVSVAAGGSHACAATEDGSVWCWGSNSQRQLGVDGGNRLEPVKVEGVSGAVQVAAGGNLTCARLESAEVTCWGAVYDPAVKKPASPPIMVRGIEDAAEVDVGIEHACAVRLGGGVDCWGRRVEEYHSGALPSRRPGLRTVYGLDDATQVALGRLHGCALRASGGVACWGYNRYGQLGLGNNDKTSYPQKVIGVDDGFAIASGRDHSCVARAKRVQCWGGHFGRDTAPCKKNPASRCPTRYVRYGVEPKLIPGVRP